MLRATAAAAVVILAGGLLGHLAARYTGDDHDAPWNQTRQEGPSNLDGIRTAQIAYFAEFDRFVSAPWTPATLPGARLVDFAGPGRASWERLGWVADGRVRCRYKTVAHNQPDSGTSDFEAIVECDMDGDGRVQRYEASRSLRTTLKTPSDIH